MHRTIEDIRENLDYVGCDNATAAELCDEVDRLLATLNRELRESCEIGTQLQDVVAERDRLREEVLATRTQGAEWEGKAIVAEEERDRLRAGCNPECPGCGLKPCNERGTATLWCDDCVGEIQAERDRLLAELSDCRTALAVHSGRTLGTADDAPAICRALASLAQNGG